VQGPHPEHHPLPAFLPVAPEPRGKLHPERPHGPGDPGRHLVVPAPRGAHPPRELAEQRQPGLQLLGHVGAVEGAIEVDDAVPEDLVLQDVHPVRTARL